MHTRGVRSRLAQLGQSSLAAADAEPAGGCNSLECNLTPPLARPFRPRSTLALIKPDAFKNFGKILHAIYQSGFLVK